MFVMIMIWYNKHCTKNEEILNGKLHFLCSEIYWQRSLKIQNCIKVGCLFIVNEDYSLDTRLLFPLHMQYSPLEKGDGKQLRSSIQAMISITPQNWVTYVFLNASDLVAHEWKRFIEMSVVLAQKKICEYVLVCKVLFR